MESYGGSGGIAPRILDLGTWRDRTMKYEGTRRCWGGLCGGTLHDMALTRTEID
jgi:hypothetical protein